MILECFEAGSVVWDSFARYFPEFTRTTFYDFWRLLLAHFQKEFVNNDKYEAVIRIPDTMIWFASWSIETRLADTAELRKAFYFPSSLEMKYGAFPPILGAGYCLAE
jgi:hypothetical protein